MIIFEKFQIENYFFLSDMQCAGQDHSFDTHIDNCPIKSQIGVCKNTPKNAKRVILTIFGEYEKLTIRTFYMAIWVSNERP